MGRAARCGSTRRASRHFAFDASKLPRRAYLLRSLRGSWQTGVGIRLRFAVNRKSLPPLPGRMIDEALRTMIDEVLTQSVKIRRPAVEPGSNQAHLKPK